MREICTLVNGTLSSALLLGSCTVRYRFMWTFVFSANCNRENEVCEMRFSTFRHSNINIWFVGNCRDFWFAGVVYVVMTMMSHGVCDISTLVRRTD